MSYFERDGLNFHFAESGSGIPLIFSHGLGGNLSRVRDQIGPLAGVRVIVYDNRGHGLTSGAGDPRKLTFACMADDMAAVLDCFRINSAVIAGESMGAGISLAFWRRHRPRVRALILSRPAWLNAPYPPNLAILGTAAKLIDEFGREEALAHFAQSADFIQFENSQPETAKSLMSRWQDPTNSNLAVVYKCIPASVPFEKFEDLGGIDVPTLVLASHGDPLHPFECASRLAAAIPGATLKEFPSKNQSVDEHQRVFRSQLGEFIASLPAR
jgi:pimeloyl-ACP methyl ester carboxylesterase